MADRDRDIKVEVDASSSVGWAFFTFGLMLLTWGEPDLLDVLQEFCRRYMERL